MTLTASLWFASSADAAPGNPGVPGPPTVVFQEDFENVPNPAAAQLLADYTGAPPVSMTYTAHADWLNSAACNGVISSWNATATAGSCPVGIYNGFVRPIARGMGAVLGGGDDNQVMSDVTIFGFSAAPTPAATLQTESAISLPSANRFITFSIDAGAVTCGPTAAHPLLRFFLLDGSEELAVSNNAINACTDPRGSTIPPGQTGAGVRVGSYASDGSLFFTGNSLGVKMTNDQTSGSGNDYAVDNLRALDATPQLDKVFDSPTPRGEPTTLTFTITNTSDLAAKEDWSFTDTLPAGLEVADPAGTTTNCTNGSVAANSGGDTIEVSGDLETNRAFCTATVEVVTAEPGDYENCAENISDLVGLDPPGCSTLTVQPVGDLAITKQSEPGPHLEGELVHYILAVTNNGPDDAEGVEVLDDLPPGLSLISATPEQGTCSASDPVDCDLGTITNGSSVEIEVVAEIAAGQGGNAITNTATVDANTPDTQASNNSADASIDVEPEDGPSYLAKRGFDPTTNSTATSGGPDGTTGAGDVIDWVVSYRNQTGARANVNITDPITGNQRFVPGSLQTPPGLEPRWSTDGGVLYGSPEPGSGVNAVGATGTSVPGSTGAQVQANPPPPSSVPPPGGGDGFETLFIGDNIYNVWHHRGGLSGTTPITVLDCHVRTTGARCANYPTYVSPNAGDPFGTGPSTLTTATFTQAAVSGTRIYYPVGVIGTRNDGVACADVATQTSCGFFQLGSYSGGGTNSNSNSATINGGAVMGDRYYTVSHDGEIYCFNLSTESACQGYAPTVSDPTAPALRTWPYYNLQAWDDRYLFGTLTRPASPVTTRDLICIDTTTHQRCPGFPQHGYATWNSAAINNTLAPILDTGGDVTGVCGVAATTTTEHPFKCFDLNGNAVPTPFSETQTANTQVNWPSFGSIEVIGTRLYFAESNNSNGRATYTCWDYSATPSAPGKIGNVCQGFIPGSTNQNVKVYTLRQDPQNPECIWALGDTNRFEVFSATFGGTGCRFGNAVVELTPEDFYCDGAEGHVSGWEAIRLGGLTSADYDGLAVTITDEDGDPVPGWQNRIISNASQLVDISSIPYSGSTTTLNVAVAVSWGSKPVKPVTVTTTFDGDPPQMCFQTRVRAADCTDAQQITNEANAITNAGPGNNDGPEGNDSGPVTFEQPADLAACRADLELAKTTDATNGAVPPGGAVEWTLTVTNNGPDASTGSTVTDLLPTGVTNLQTTTPGCEIEGSLLTCEVGPLDPDGSAEIVLTGNAPQASSTCFENAASVEGDEPDPEDENNEASIRTCTNAAADLELSKSATPQLMEPGDPVTYTLTVTNHGPDPSTGSTVTDTLPGNLTNVQVPGNCELDGSALTCTVGALDPDEDTDIVVTANAPDSPATCFTNAASVEGEEGDPVAANDQGSVRACTTPNADLQFSKSAADFVDPGGQVTWTLTVTNNGTADSSGATVTDTLPQGITNIQAPGCTVQGQTITCQVGALDADDSTDILITGTAPDAPSTCFENDASVEGGATESDPNPDNNEASARTCTREADLELTKTIDDDLVSPGTGLEWAITVTNNGPDQSSAATVTDTLPTGVTNVATQDPRCEVQGNSISCDIDPLDDGESTDIVITGDAPETSSTCFENAASVASTGGDLTEGNNGDSVRACTTPIANLELSKSAPAVVDPGGQVTWTIRATNRGPDPSTGLTVSDTLPSGITGIQATGCDVQDQTITCTSDVDLAIDEFVEFQITGTAPNTGSTCFENAASVEGERGDPDLTDNDASVETCTNEGADVEVTKTAGPGPYFAGDNVTYAIAVKNNGPATAHDVTLDDDLPDTLTLVSATPEQGDCNDADPLQCDLGTIGSGETVDITLVATIGADQSGTEISNTACATRTEPDPFDGNDCDTEPITVQPEVDLELTKVAEPGPYSTGDEVSYTLTVTNNGPDDAHFVRVDDDLPGALTLISATASQGACNPSDPLVCELGEIAVGNTVEIDVVARIGDGHAGNQIENTACTEGQEFEPDESNNCDTEPIDVEPAPSGKPKLKINKRASDDEARPGEVISYRIVVRNKGKADARRVRVCDKLPTGLKVLDAPGADTDSKKKVCWKLKSLKAGGKRKFKVVAQIALNAKAGGMKNKAIVKAANGRGSRDAAEVDVEPVGGPCPSFGAKLRRC